MSSLLLLNRYVEEVVAGYAVEVNMSKVLCEAICNRLMQKSIAI